MKLAHYPLRVLQNRMGWIPRPSWVTYLVCNRCNARCSMCDSWRIPRGVELSSDEVAQVFAKIGSLDVVRLSGGEPFLRSDLPEVARAVMCASDPAVLHVTTNGSFPDRVLKFARHFEKPKRLKIMVSVDGMPDTHDRNRGKVVTFERVHDTVRGLTELRSRGVHVSVNHTIISRDSLREAPRVKQLFRRMGVDVHWVLAYSDSAMYGAERRGSCAEDLAGFEGYPLHPELDRAEARRFVDQELQTVGDLADSATRWAKRYYMRGLSDRLGQVHLPCPKPKCVALRSHLRLLPDGAVVVCQFNTESLGNLLDKSFEELWHSAGTRAWRAWVDACRGCWAECEVMPNALYSGDIFSQAAAKRG
jgi:Fe-coproporphyrin III synthase